MTQKVKIALGVVALLAVVVVGLVTTKPEMFQGRLQLNPSVKAANLTCPATWTKALTGNYSFAVNPNEGSDRVQVTGITTSQVQGLANAIQDGCDVKFSFKSVSGNNFKEPTVVCDQTFKMGNLADGVYAGCVSTTGLVSNTKYDKNSEFLYDTIHLWTDQGKVNLSKDRVTHWLNDWAPTSASYFITNGEYTGDWQVNVFLKK